MPEVKISEATRKNVIGNNAIGKNAVDICFHKAKNESLIWNLNIFQKGKVLFVIAKNVKKCIYVSLKNKPHYK